MKKFPVLESEICRRGTKKTIIAAALGISVRALYNKLEGKSIFGWEELNAIQSRFFPDMQMSFLFSKEGDDSGVKPARPTAGIPVLDTVVNPEAKERDRIFSQAETLEALLERLDIFVWRTRKEASRGGTDPHQPWTICIEWLEEEVGWVARSLGEASRSVPDISLTGAIEAINGTAEKLAVWICQGRAPDWSSLLSDAETALKALRAASKEVFMAKHRLLWGDWMEQA